MRGSQRARNILTVMREEAFTWFNVTVGYGPNARTRRQRPLSGRQIAQLKREYLMRGEYAPLNDMLWHVTTIVIYTGVSFMN